MIRKYGRIGKKIKTIIGYSIKKIINSEKKLKENNKKNNVLFFLPEMPVELYAKMMVNVANTVRKDGFEPVFFGCSGFLNVCMLQDGLNVRSSIFRNGIVCVKCKLCSLDSVVNNDFVHLECGYSRVKKVQFSGNSLDERLEYRYKGIPIGRLVYYNVSILFKRDRSRQDLTEREIVYYDDSISDAVGIIDYFDEIGLNKFICSVVSIDEYSTANIVREWARINGLSAFRAGFSYHFNADPQFVTLSSCKTRAVEKSGRLNRWERWCDVPLPEGVVDEIAADLIFRMSGSGGHIFSSNYSGNLPELISKYGLRTDIKTFVVFTSSNDEIDAISELSNAFGDELETNDAFSSQHEWLDSIIEHARDHDVQVIIKMHPRLSKSHRDTGDAEDMHQYRTLADAAPNNVFFVWPEEDVSAYDILQFADVCLTSWGTMGLEAAKLGVPVVTGITKIAFTTPDIGFFRKAKSKDQFLGLLSNSLENLSVDDLAKAYRWHHLLHMSSAIITDRNRSFKTYGKEFPYGLSDALADIDIEEKKYEFLYQNILEDEYTARFNERVAILAAIEKVIRFFESNAGGEPAASKLISRLRRIDGVG